MQEFHSGNYILDGSILKTYLHTPIVFACSFIDAIRSGKNGALNCDIEEGFLSSALPLMANISYRLGRQLKFNGAKEQFENDPEADAMLTREYRKPYIISNQV